MNIGMSSHHQKQKLKQNGKNLQKNGVFKPNRNAHERFTTKPLIPGNTLPVQIRPIPPRKNGLLWK